MDRDIRRAWFAPKAYGYGARPVTWQGWALCAGFVAAILGLAWVFIGQAPADGPGTAGLVAFFALTASLALALVLIARATTDGGWRWRWGERDGARN